MVQSCKDGEAETETFLLLQRKDFLYGISDACMCVRNSNSNQSTYFNNHVLSTNNANEFFVSIERVGIKHCNFQLFKKKITVTHRKGQQNAPVE